MESHAHALINVFLSEQEAFEKRVIEINETYVAAYKKADWDTIKTLYCDDVMEMPPHLDCVQGKDGSFPSFFISQQYMFLDFSCNKNCSRSICNGSHIL